MKFYTRKYKDIKDIKGERFFFVSAMREFCRKGPFEFERVDDNWFRAMDGIAMGFVWHISWLIPYLKDKQYILEF